VVDLDIRFFRFMRCFRYGSNVEACDRMNQPLRLKYCTARSWRSAAARVAKVPRLRRFPVLAIGLREYNR